MNEIKIPSTHEILRDIEANVFISYKKKEANLFLSNNEKEISVCFHLSNLYRLLTAESYQSFSKNKENFDKLSQKEKQLKEMSKKAKRFCKKADAKLKSKFRSSLYFYRDILIHKKRYYKIEDFNAIVDFIVQENLLVPTIKPLPVINMAEVDSYVLKVIE
ncbi:hypothetical protein V470_04300 [Streptococcus sp. VT 162]|nr:hypothetical protein V470_04300 [Streptococcus sp. VT 162]